MVFSIASMTMSMFRFCWAEIGMMGEFRGHGALDEILDLVIMLHHLLPGHEIDLVLDDDDLIDSSDVQGHEVLFGLWLRAGLIG